MKRLLAVLLMIQIALFFVVSQPAMAQTPRDADSMFAADQLYQTEQFVEASLIYQQLVDQGRHEAALYYNLGNAYYRQGELGLAIANYLRAEEINPRDPDIQANLRAARSQTEDSFGTAGRTLFTRWVDTVSSWVTLTEIAVAALILWTVFGLSVFVLLLVRFRWVRRFVILLGVTSGVMFVVSAITLVGRISEDASSPDVVVIAEIVNAVEGPGSQFQNEFTLHDGTEAVMEEQRGNWIKIELLDGQQEGWLPSSAVEKVAISQNSEGFDWSLPF